MIRNAYTEDEFKKMVKTLLLDRQRDEDETEIEILRKQLERVKPALKKLNDELKETKEELEKLRKREDETFAEKENEIAALLGEKINLLNALGAEKKKSEDYEQELKSLTIRTLSENQTLNERLEESHLLIESLKNKNQQLEALYHQSDLANLRREKERLQEELVRKEACFEESLVTSYEKLKGLFQKNALLNEEFLALKDIVTKRESQLIKREREIEGLETLVEASKAKAQEKEEDVRKAQKHLAKKVKEVALLRDVLEKQKDQLMEQQSEVEKLKNALQLQVAHVEKMEVLAQAREQECGSISKEWQAKYDASHKEQELKLQEVNREHEILKERFANVKAHLTKAFEVSEEGK